MCGIAGLAGARPIAEIGRQVQGMTDALRHRGPDGDGVWVDASGAVALGHRRLAVVDPVARSDQPMRSPDGRYAVSFNGELYNYREVRRELIGLGRCFATESDTEVLVHAIAEWGVEGALDRLEGMFAFAAWDATKRQLWLCRDRFGIKPCYWMWRDGVLAFGSELKALFAWWREPMPLRPAAVRSLLEYGYVASPHCIFEGISQLEPGQLLQFRPGEEPRTRFYWDVRERKRRQAGRLDGAGDAELLDATDTLLDRAVQQYLQADVPVGCFLSGGIDSSLIAAVAARHTGRLKTFAIGFAEAKWDESWKAREVARHIGTEHHELMLGAAEARGLVDALPRLYDEPFADFSQLPTLAVSRLARQQVTVSLSGDGGDELFAGYDRYGWAQNFWTLVHSLPKPLAEAVLDHLQHNRVAPTVPASLPASIREVLVELPKKLPFGRPIRSFEALYERIIRTGAGAPFRAGAGAGMPGLLQDWPDAPELGTTDRMQLADLRRYMGDGILTKVDRASMSVGLEVRIPLLSEPLVDFALELPERMKFTGTTQRRLQKELAYRYVPQALIDHPKMGFGFPIDSWLRGCLRDWGEALLSPQSLSGIPYLDAEAAMGLWRTHQSGAGNEHWRLWPVLIYAQWFHHWRRHIAA